MTTSVQPTELEILTERQARERARNAQLARGTTAESVLREWQAAGYVFELVEAHDMDNRVLLVVYADRVDPNYDEQAKRYRKGPYRDPQRASALLTVHDARLRELISSKPKEPAA